LTGTTDFNLISSRAAASLSPTSGSSPSSPSPDRLAFDLFVDRILDYIGSYYLKLDGRVDALVFAGGIGEHSKELRRVVVERLACLGFVGVSRGGGEDDDDGVVVDIGDGTPQDGKRIYVCRTDEQVRMDAVFF
jgi:acetate kinase